MLPDIIGIVGLASLVLGIIFSVKRNTKMQILFVTIAITLLIIRSAMLFFN
jgi:hypothetical protein